MILFALIAGGMTIPLVAFILGFFVGRRLGPVPAFYQHPVQLPVARLIVIEAVRDRRADISAALRRA